jgi:membrane-bound ClpP family serine protease
MIQMLGYTLEIIYLYGLIIGGILTFLYILFSDFLEGFFEVIPDGIFNPTLVLSFITLLSSIGYLLEKLTSANSILIGFIAIILAFGCTVLLNIFVLIPLSSAESTLAYTEEDLKGRVGKVITSIPVDGFGEVIIEGIGGNISKSAVSFDNEEIPYGKEVLIIDVQKGVLHVSPHEELEDI